MRKPLHEYLPPILLKTCEFPILCSTEQAEIDTLQSCIDEVLNAQFVSEATENGITRYEKIFGIVPQDTDTLDERRFKILTKINTQLPYTERQLKRLLAALCGENGYKMKINYAGFVIEVKVELTAKRSLTAVQELLLDTVPANMVIECSLLYNWHEKLSGFTHAQLAAYTHKELREEVLPNAQ